MNQPSAPYLVRDGMAESSATEVLRAPLENSNLNLAICRQSLPQDVVQFLDRRGWRLRCYELFKSRLAGYNAKEGFFSKWAPDGPVLIPEDKTEGVPLYNRDSNTTIYFNLTSNSWSSFLSDLEKQKAHPLIQHIELRRQEILRCFNAATAEIQIRFESPSIHSPICNNFDWHSDGNAGVRILSVLKGKETEFIRSPYVTVTASRLYYMGFSRERRIWLQTIKRLRYSSGKRFDATRRFATDLSKVESLRRGDLAHTVGSPELSTTLGILHRRPGTFRSRIVLIITPKR